MNTSDAPESGLMPTENAAGKIINPASTATIQSMMLICTADLSKSVWRVK